MLDGYDTWLDAAHPLWERVVVLTQAKYESRATTMFDRDYHEARRIWNEARERLRIEREALGGEQLRKLAEKLARLPRDPESEDRAC